MHSFNPLLPLSLPSFSFLRSFIFSVFSLLSVWELAVLGGVRLRPQGFTSHTPRWQFVVPHTDNDLHFSLLPDLMALCLRVCHKMKWDLFIRRFFSFFTECGLQGNTCFTCDWLFSLVCCYCFISGCEWYIISPAAWCEQVVSFMISIDESSPGESISWGCSLVAQPPPLAVPDSCLGCLTFPAAP